MVKLTSKSPYVNKDQAKSDRATQFIGIGAIGSSTHQYARDWGDKANSGEYTSEDIVFISINGKRSNRKGFEYIKDLVDKAIEADAKFITDNEYHRNRDFNIGEREVAQYLKLNGYEEIDTGFWGKKQQTKLREQSMFKQFSPIQYLAIDIANHFGLDKETYEARINWVKQNQDRLESLQNQAEEPILYAKAVKALRDTDNGLPTGHTVALDSVNSGLQIMSAVVRDKRGCELTGLIDPDIRSDAYTAIMQRMNELLKQDDVEEVQVSRKEAKEACMTWAYGSKAVPERIFGDLVEYFYEAMEREFQGVTELLGVLTASWNSWALHHKWTLPDLHMAYVPVMQTVKERYKVEELDYQPTVIYSKNEGEEFGISNIANVVHSLDAYVLRTMVRYCNYHKGNVLNFVRKVEQAKYKEVQTNEMVQKWQDTGIADISFINHIDDVSVYPFEMINQLYNKCSMLLQYESFEIITIHDSFACHANHCQRMRYYYNFILAELSDSTTIDDICSQLFNEKGEVEKGDELLSDYIRQANYAIC